MTHKTDPEEQERPNTHEPAAAPEAEGAAPAEAPEGEAPAREEDAASPETLEALEQARQEARENYDRLLRAYAELENYKKRVERERRDLMAYANEGLLRELLGVVDNLERAVEQGRGEAAAAGVVEGVEMILKQLVSILQGHGVAEIPALGRPFDPNVHEAVLHEPDEEHEENTVTQVLQKGYRYKDRLLRPAMVKVSKGPARAEAAADPESAAE